jgi:steroid delta-isomerase-like uncharacterized protein
VRIRIDAFFGFEANMKPSISVLIVLLSTLAASCKEAQMSVNQTAETNKQLVRRLYEECLNPGKMELIAQFVADDYVSPRGEKGPSGFANPNILLRQGFPDIQYTLEDLIAEGDRVAVRWKWQGTHKGPFGGFQASQKQLTNEGMAIFQIKDYKIVRVWLQTDRLGFLQEIGAVPKDLGAGPQSKENK